VAVVTDDNLDAQVREVLAADWREVPGGYYAVAIHDDDEEYALLGYKLLERRVARGRAAAGWHWSYRVADGIDPGRLDAHLRATESDPVFDRQLDIHRFITDPEYREACREDFGKLTGRCGVCGRALTDAESKMRGVGPECWKALADYRASSAAPDCRCNIGACDKPNPDECAVHGELHRLVCEPRS
jgi:hypothetical protein